MELKNQYKLVMNEGSINEITEDVTAFIAEHASKELNWQQLEEDVSEMELFDAIIFEGISIQRIL